jgi:hypothetical protein
MVAEHEAEEMTGLEMARRHGAEASRSADGGGTPPLLRIN